MAEAEVTMIPQNYVTLTDENAIKIPADRTLDLLDEDDDVQNCITITGMSKEPEYIYGGERL